MELAHYAEKVDDTQQMAKKTISESTLFDPALPDRWISCDPTGFS